MSNSAAYLSRMLTRQRQALAANIHGTFNQYFSDFLSEKMCERSRAAVLAGRWPWSAPLGYLNVDCKNGANIVHDPQRAPLIHRAFEMVSTGSYTESDVLRTVTLEGLTRKSGKPLSKQTLYALLRNPVYAGWIVSRKTGLQSKGLHRPIVEQALFDAEQRILRGDKPNPVPRRKLNPEFPLRRFVLCAACNRPLTGGFSRSKTGKRHGYYHCCVCGQNVRKDRLETQFLELLKRLQPSEETVQAFPKIAADIWAEQQGDAAEQAKCINARLEKLKQKKSQLVRSLVGEEDPGLQDAYRAEHRKISSEIAEAEVAIQEVALCRDEADAFIRFVELSLMDIAECWKQAGPEDRVGVQSLLFFGGLSYSPKTESLNPANSTLFKMLDRIVSEKINLARPEGLELEPFCGREGVTAGDECKPAGPALSLPKGEILSAAKDLQRADPTSRTGAP